MQLSSNISLRNFDGSVCAPNTFERIVSLVPSVTETLLNYDTPILAKTDYCIYPAEKIKSIQSVRGTKNPNIEKILELKPDLIIANKEENRKKDIDLLKQHTNVWVTYPNCIETLFEYLQDLSYLILNEKKFAKDLLNLKQTLSNLKKNNVEKKKHSFAFMIWKKPWMCAASKTYINSIIDMFAQNAFESLQRYPQVELKSLAQNTVDTVLLSTEPYAFSMLDKVELSNYFNSEGVSKKIEIVCGEDFTWPGFRVLKALKKILELIPA